MNLYAVCAAYAPFESDTHLFLAKDDEAAMNQGIFIAAKDACGIHFSTSAEVFLVIKDVQKIGDAMATDAPAEWRWAHPGIERALAMDEEVKKELEALGHGQAAR